MCCCRNIGIFIHQLQKIQVKSPENVLYALLIVWLYPLGLSGNPQEKCEKCNKHNANAHFICYVIIVPVVQYLKNKPFC
jgi:hypothetical protein